MSRLGYKIICIVLAFVSGVTLTRVTKGLFAGDTSPVAANPAATDAAPEESQLTSPSVHSKGPTDFLIAEDRWTHDGYTIERRSRKAPRDDGEGPTASPIWVDVYYVVIKKAGRVQSRFDADVYFGLGNSANFALFPFLGGETQQVFISQDIFRGGRQWIVSLSPRFRIFFDGYKYSVGRESYDLSAIDLDKDGIYEITVPIISFYGFANLSPAGTPLPTIVFKYNGKSEKYLPANPLFREYLLRDIDKQKAAIKPD